MKLDDGRLTFVAQQEVTALDAIHKAVLGKAACAGRVTEGVGTCISIHAPTWGATSWDDYKVWKNQFQSTHPRGVRLRLVVVMLPMMNFNPRTHVGCDFAILIIAYKHLKFQSTHPRGVRLCHTNYRLQTSQISIHAPTWGATRGKISSRCNPKFQSTHPRGVRLLSHQMVGF